MAGAAARAELNAGMEVGVGGTQVGTVPAAVVQGLPPEVRARDRSISVTRSALETTLHFTPSHPVVAWQGSAFAHDGGGTTLPEARAFLKARSASSSPEANAADTVDSEHIMTR